MSKLIDWLKAPHPQSKRWVVLVSLIANSAIEYARARKTQEFEQRLEKLELQQKVVYNALLRPRPRKSTNG